jgi:hypothetical protein
MIPEHNSMTKSCIPQTRDQEAHGNIRRLLGVNHAESLASTCHSGHSPFRSMRVRAANAALLLCIGLIVSGCVTTQTTTDTSAVNIPNPLLNATYTADADNAFVMEPAMAGNKAGKVNFASESASRRTRDMAHWIVSTGDNANMPFAIVDKVNAKVYVFSADGKFYGAAPVLLGIGIGDHAPLDAGSKPMSQIPVKDRTTPAGRFVSVMGRNHKGKDILWVDYDQALSMHAVVRGTARDRRAERLASPTPRDNRISFGCINVPTNFFNEMIKGKFSDAGGVVYILPESNRLG